MGLISGRALRMHPERKTVPLDIYESAKRVQAVTGEEMYYVLVRMYINDFRGFRTGRDVRWGAEHS